jgi:hypothetical protein
VDRVWSGGLRCWRRSRRSRLPRARFQVRASVASGAGSESGWDAQESVAHGLRLARGQDLRVAGRASSRVQATRSAAIWVSINQVVLIANSRDGNRPSPESLACRMRSSNGQSTLRWFHACWVP